jgi:uncharacterized membrane protein
MDDTAGGPVRILLVGESWVTHSVHMKGFDAFHTTSYTEGAGVFIDRLASLGHPLDYIRAHEIAARFPTTHAALDAYDVVVLSDIGANSFLLTDETFVHSRLAVNRLGLLADWVRGGGGLVMVGGYLSFAGIDGRARYGASPLAAVLPVEIAATDDRVETPDGVTPRVEHATHPALGGVGDAWPALLGYNHLARRGDAETLVTVGADPLVVVGRAEAGRVGAFASDLAPHWAPPAFTDWAGYPRLWSSLLGWVGAEHNRLRTELSQS